MLEVILVLVRHGEADHNVKENTAIIDFLEEGEKRLMDSSPKLSVIKISSLKYRGTFSGPRYCF